MDMSKPFIVLNSLLGAFPLLYSATYRSVFAAPFPKLIYAGLDPAAIPQVPIKPFHPGVVGSGTGPNAGIRQLKMDVDEATHDKGDAATYVFDLPLRLIVHCCVWWLK